MRLSLSLSFILYFSFSFIYTYVPWVEEGEFKIEIWLFRYCVCLCVCRLLAGEEHASSLLLCGAFMRKCRRLSYRYQMNEFLFVCFVCFPPVRRTTIIYNEIVWLCFVRAKERDCSFCILLQFFTGFSFMKLIKFDEIVLMIKFFN